MHYTNWPLVLFVVMQVSVCFSPNGLRQPLWKGHLTQEKVMTHTLKTAVLLGSKDNTEYMGIGKGRKDLFYLNR